MVIWDPSTPNSLEFVDPVNVVQANERLHFPHADYYYDDHTHERPCPSEMSDDECDSMYEFHYLHNSIMENITAYENNEISAVDMATVLTNFIVTMDERGMFDLDGHMSLDDFDVSSWDLSLIHISEPTRPLYI